MNIAILIITVSLLFAGLAIGGFIARQKMGYRKYDLIFALVALIPLLTIDRIALLFNFEIMGSFYSAYDFFIASLIAVFGLYSVTKANRPAHRSIAAGVLCVVLGLILLGTISATLKNSYEGLAQSIYAHSRWLPAMILATLLIRLAPRDELAVRNLRTTFVLIYGVLNGIIMITTAMFAARYASAFSWTGDYDGDSVMRAWSPLGTSISSGIFLVVSVIFSISAITTRDRVKIHIAALTVITIAVLLTQSRSVVATLLIASTIYLALTLKTRASSTLRPVMFMGLIFGGALLWVATNYSVDRLLSQGTENSDDWRESSLRAAIKSFSKDPMIGSGPGVIYEVARFPAVARANLPNYLILNDEYSALEPHNLYALIAVEYGLIGVALFILLVYLFTSRLRIRSRGIKPPIWMLHIVNANLSIAIAILAFMMTWGSAAIYPKIALASFITLSILNHSSSVMRERHFHSSQAIHYE